MKTKIFIFTAILYIAFTTLTSNVFATNHDGGVDGLGGCSPSDSCIENPLQSQTIPEFILKIIDVLLVFALPIIVLYIMYAGFLFVTANGNESQLTQAKNALLWSVVGGVIALGAKLILEVIQGTVAVF